MTPPTPMTGHDTRFITDTQPGTTPVPGTPSANSSGMPRFHMKYLVRSPDVKSIAAPRPTIHQAISPPLGIEYASAVKAIPRQDAHRFVEGSAIIHQGNLRRGQSEVPAVQDG